MRTSDYGMQLREKQKVKRMYGVLERQFRRYFAKARRRKGNTGANLLRLLEIAPRQRRLPHGLRLTRAEARQLVSHKAITVNGKMVNIPSYQVKAGDAVALPEKARSQLRVQEAADRVRQAWTCVRSGSKCDAKKFEGTFKTVPDRARTAVRHQRSVDRRAVLEVIEPEATDMAVSSTRCAATRGLNVEQLGANRAKVMLEPFERGYGHTLGNALRRVLLSSMPGAPTEVRSPACCTSTRRSTACRKTSSTSC